MAHLVYCSRIALARAKSQLILPCRYIATSGSSFSDDFRQSEDLAKERYESRANEDIEKKRARLVYQSRKRGMLENGVILASFADKFLKTADEHELDQYDRLINLPTNDWDIFYWATRTKPTPKEYETSVMKKLREHLKSKVSKTQNNQDINEKDKHDARDKNGFWDRQNPETVLVKPMKEQHDLEMDFSQVSLTDYKQALFDERKIRVGRYTMERMTNWRRRHFEQRIRRTISSPISLRHLDSTKSASVYSVQTDEVDTKSQLQDLDLPWKDDLHERTMKQHNFMQYLFNNTFTQDVIEYEAEVKAWANILWHRNYGRHDIKSVPSNLACHCCKSKIHCCDTGLDGYVPTAIFAKFMTESRIDDSSIVCQRCKFTDKYGANLDVEVSPDEYPQLLENLRDVPTSVVCALVDLTDFPGGIHENLVDLIHTRHKIIVVGNKIDLLPYDGPNMVERVLKSFKQNLSKLRTGNDNLQINDHCIISAKTGFNLNALVSRLLKHCGQRPTNVYLLGSSNSGKSTLFNALLQSNLSAATNMDIISRISEYNWPGLNSDKKLLRFPINKIEEWEQELNERRVIRQERDFAGMDKVLVKTYRRQESNPHMSLLIDRLDYGAQTGDEDGFLPKLSPDHPLTKVDEKPHLSATPDKYEGHGFFHMGPSAFTPDQLHQLLTLEERLIASTKETIAPRKFSLRPLESILIGGLARLDLLTSTSNVIFTVFASKYLPIHVMPTRKADQFYKTFLGTPILGAPLGNRNLNSWPGLRHPLKDFHIRGASETEGASDVVLSSAGWIMANVGPDQECLVRAYTPDARGIYLRDPPLLRHASRRYFGRKIRDTPLFQQPRHFKTSRMSSI